MKRHSGTVRRIGLKNLVEFGGADLELFFAIEILKLRSLHYGFWDNPPRAGTLSLESLREAQARFSERLFMFIPQGVQSVLDVGAGVGDQARELTLRGYRVTAISPDKYHGRHFEPLRDLGVSFHNTTLEAFESRERFDLVFMSESLNYFPWAAGLEQSRRYLNKGGHLLVAAMFRAPEGRRFEESFKPGQLPYVDRAATFGFTLTRSLDITANVAPTVDMVHAALGDYARPSVRFIGEFLTGSAPFKTWLLKKLFAKQLLELGRILRYYEERTGPSEFR